MMLGRVIGSRVRKMTRRMWRERGKGVEVGQIDIGMVKLIAW